MFRDPSLVTRPNLWVGKLTLRQIFKGVARNSWQAGRSSEWSKTLSHPVPAAALKTSEIRYRIRNLTGSPRHVDLA